MKYDQIKFPTVNGPYVGQFLIEQEMRNRDLDLGYIWRTTQVCYRARNRLFHLDDRTRHNPHGGLYFHRGDLLIRTPAGSIIDRGGEDVVFYSPEEHEKWVEQAKVLWGLHISSLRRDALEEEASRYEKQLEQEETHETVWKRWRDSVTWELSYPVDSLREIQPVNTILRPSRIEGYSMLSSNDPEGFKDEFLSRYPEIPTTTRNTDLLEQLGLPAEVTSASLTFSGASKERLLSYLSDPQVFRILSRRRT